MSRSSDAWKPSSAASNFLRFFEARVAPVMHRLGELAFVAAVREALPWSFAGLAAGFVLVFAIQYAGSPGGETLGIRLANAFLPSFGIMAATLVVLLAQRLALRTGYALLPLLAGSVASFALALPRPFGADALAYLRTLGATGLFLAILACGVTGAAIALVRRMTNAPAADWLGATAAVAVFALLLAAHLSVAAGIAAAMQPLARLGDSYVALLAIVAIETLLWSAGVHGPAVLAAVLTPVYFSMQIANTHALQAHAPLPYIVVVSLFLFVFPGGAGATFSLAALLAVSRVPRLWRIGRVTLLPALFNINDPLLFGAPVVFNPYFVVPFVGTPIVLATVTYFVVAEGLVSRAAFYVPSFVPAPIGTYLATQDVRAIALTIVNILLAFAMYYPFVRAYERHVGSTAQPA
ncbi:MAG: PTS sugar transporter subunit IIC [Candidatus Eremiobacteraeota bacterium]|nr:PTS sugar transporter subunit IIC [Candidatus Eremiobacteraeota bacterium]